MTSTPPDPQSSRRDRRFDEVIAVLIAFGTLGGILFWSLSQKDQGFDLLSSLSPTTSPSAIAPSPASPAPEAIATAAPIPAPATNSPSAEAASPTPASGRTVPFIAPVPIQNEASAPAPTPSAAESPTPPANTGFSDVPSAYWAAPFVAALSQRGIIEGFENGTFQPDKPVTRAEFATMIQKALDKPKVRQPISFRDVPQDYWAAAAINEAVQSGFLNGYPNRVFQPNQEIPKVQVLTAIANGFQLKPQAQPAQVLKVYQDAGQIPAYAIDKTAAATESGLVVNYPERTQLDPGKITTRADAAAIIYQALVREGKADAIPSNYVVRPQ